jgi:hypothetical protein
LRDHAFRSGVGWVADEIKYELIVDFLRQIFCRVVGVIFILGDVDDAEWILLDVIAYPVEFYFDGSAVLLVDGVVCYPGNPMAVMLSHNIVVGSWCYSMWVRIRMVRRPVACWPPMNMTAYSASPREYTT